MEYAMMDAMIIPVHRHGHGAKGGEKKSGHWQIKRGMDNQNSCLDGTDALGNFVRFCLLPGNRYDTVGAARLIENIHFSAMIADKAFNCDWIIEEMNKRKAKTTAQATS